MSSPGVNIDGLLPVAGCVGTVSIGRSPTPRGGGQRWGKSVSTTGEISVSVVSGGGVVRARRLSALLPLRPGGAHTGLDVSVDESDLRRAGGYLSRQGPPVLRWALVEAAINASHQRSPNHTYYSAVKERHDGKLAAISVARQFTRRCYHILRNLDPNMVYATPSAA